MCSLRRPGWGETLEDIVHGMVRGRVRRKLVQATMDASMDVDWGAPHIPRDDY